MLAGEVTREQLYLQLHAELPYASAVETEAYKERDDGSVEIHQQILVARPTQRAIVLGKQGSRIKEIGAKARSEEHTSELQSLMRISYAVFCLKKKKMNKLTRIMLIPSLSLLPSFTQTLSITIR